jgi:hypothetical protein
VTGGAARAAGRASAGARAKAEFFYSPSAHWKWCEAAQAAAIWRHGRQIEWSVSAGASLRATTTTPSSGAAATSGFASTRQWADS